MTKAYIGYEGWLGISLAKPYFDYVCPYIDYATPYITYDMPYFDYSYPYTAYTSTAKVMKDRSNIWHGWRAAL